MPKEKSLEDELYIMGWIALVLGSVGLILYFNVFLQYVQVPSCVLWEYFGIYCPGCGGTRAVEALLRGHLLKSLWYHPLVLYTVVLFGSFMLTQTLERIGVPHVRGMKFRSWHLYGALAVLVINVIVKNFLMYQFQIFL